MEFKYLRLVVTYLENHPICGVGIAILLVAGLFVSGHVHRFEELSSQPLDSDEPEQIAKSAGIQLQLVTKDNGPFVCRTGDLAVATFVISNRGSERCKVMDIHQSCGCLRPKLNQVTLNSGSTEELEVSAKCPRTGDRVSGWIEFETMMESGAHISQRFNIQLLFLRAIDIDASNLRFSKTDLSAKLSLTLRRAGGLAGSTLPTITTSGPLLDTNVEVVRRGSIIPLQRDFTEEHWDVCINWGSSEAVDELLTGVLEIHETSAGSVRIPYIADFRQGVVISPDTVRFSNLRRKQRVFVRSCDRVPFEISVMRAPAGIETVIESTQQKTCHIVDIRCIDGASEYTDAELVLETTHPTSGNVSIAIVSDSHGEKAVISQENL